MPALPRRSASSGAADVPSARLGYRYAGLERFSGRPRVYESPSSSRSSSPPPLPDKQPPPLPPSSQLPSFAALTLTSSLSTKRELFFRDGPVPPAAPSAGGLLGLSKDSAGSLSSSGGGGGSAPPSYTSATGNRELAEGYVGFANLPNQVYRKAVKKGFEFTLMVVGEAGLGKSTLINSMFLTDIYSNEYPGPSHRVKKTVEVETTRVLLKEGSVNLTLTIVDTPGFGDAVDNTQCWQPIIDYIEAKYAEYLDAESRVHRTTLPDNRVHCCLYFIAPSGHGLKPLDIEFMKRLHDKVNIIPVIAKADTMTPEECSLFKRTILNEITQNKIRLYEFPDPEDEEESKLQKPLKERVPFAVVGSNTVVEVNGRRVRGRKYPWGVAEVENMDHCDYIALRNMLVRTHMQDLKDITNSVHYENYRCRKLAGVGGAGEPGHVRSNKNPLAQMEEEKKDHEAKMQRMEKEMEQVFEMKVREKMQKLKESEADLQRRHEQMKKGLEQQKLELEEKRRNFDKEKSSFEIAHRDMEDVFRKMAVDSSSKELRRSVSEDHFSSRKCMQYAAPVRKNCKQM
ncbi:septin-7-like isoform X1 [Dermacentor silvarum]|uniref:septin-7-like isoform X1 n=1 Tax=Dermacentor silvarum TaxID=543639 RepID=UPI0021008609|nr:septin-7-like isoform X1 [Dermacentor silvarum]